MKNNAPNHCIFSNVPLVRVLIAGFGTFTVIGQVCSYHSKTKEKRALKLQGSNKLGDHCTAHMKVTQVKGDRSVIVQYCSTHHSHEPENELIHLRMPESQRMCIAAKLLQGVTVDKILDNIQDNVFEEGLQREHLTTRQDVMNIKRQYNIDGIQRHTNDHSSVSAWVKEMQTLPYNPVLIFKQQGVHNDEAGIDEEDFLLGIQTKYQCDMLQLFGNNVICVDATHGTNAYDFLLITVMVIDDYGEGIPVGWAVTSREHKHMLMLYFKSLQAKSGPLSPTVFMSDDCNSYWNAWSAVFRENGSHKLLCAWHVDRSWRKALHEHVSDQPTRIELYHYLRVLLCELEESKFHQLVQQFVSLVATSQPSFCAYFQRVYASRLKQWALCYRKCKYVNTNMYVESFHRLLKVVYLEGKQNRRLDHLINVLCKIARDKAFAHFLKMNKGKLSHRIAEINRRHQLAKAMLDNGSLPQAVSDKSWEVKSSTSPECYTVTLTPDKCTCKLRCTTCSACVHMYTCSCVDSALHTTVCKHMHSVHIVRTSADIISDPVNEEETQSDSLRDCADLSCTTAPQGVNSSQYLSSILVNTTRDLERQKIEALAKVVELQTVVQSTDNPTLLTVAAKHTTNAISILRIPQREERLVVRKRCAPNQVPEKQVRFRSVKKRKSASNRSLSKPTNAEAQQLQRCLEQTAVTVCGICYKEQDNMTGDNIQWIQCSKCSIWMHEACSNVHLQGNVCKSHFDLAGEADTLQE